ncbi:11244_t:CDS:2, partial [Ambispora gerdemannii]
MKRLVRNESLRTDHLHSDLPTSGHIIIVSSQVAGTIPFKLNNHELGLQNDHKESNQINGQNYRSMKRLVRKRIIENRSFTLGPAPRAATSFSYHPNGHIILVSSHVVGTIPFKLNNHELGLRAGLQNDHKESNQINGQNYHSMKRL